MCPKSVQNSALYILKYTIQPYNSDYNNIINVFKKSKKCFKKVFFFMYVVRSLEASEAFEGILYCCL